MQGRQWQSSETPGGRHLPPLNGTGNHRPFPPRPRVDALPPTPRVARLQHKPSSPHALRHNALILIGAFVVSALLACGIGYTAFKYVNGLTASSGASTTANDFLNALSTGHYDQAYSDLDPTITLQLTGDQFKQQAGNNDRCFGTVTNYTEVPDSAVVQGNGNTLSYTYNVTRKKVPKPYQLHLTLQQNPNKPGEWKVSSYGDGLGPTQPTCK